MSNQERNLLTRSEKNQREQRSQKRKKMDRLLNVLIAIVSILIILNLAAVFNDDDKLDANEQTKEQVNKTKEHEKEEVTNQNKEEVANQNKEENEQTNDTDTSTIQQSNSNNTVALDNEQSSQLIVQSSNDPNIEEVIIDPNWKPTSTGQSGEHVSAYEEGHIDYEEKLVTFRTAVNLDADNIIFWSVKNNGSADSSVAVVSSNDRSEKYRVYIEWIQNEGWKPSKVEKLSQIGDTN